MTFRAILFDLDGTLLPMDQDEFTAGYFKELGKVLCPLGIAPEVLTRSVWAGVKAMVQNNGPASNRDVFWNQFAAVSGLDPAPFLPTANRFYSHEFHNARAYTRANPLAAEALRLARQKSSLVVLATNPLFPLDGQATRLSWLGLRPSDFDLVTSYESDHCCKPNPAYYQEICRRLSLDPGDCLMIGNDEEEDAWAATHIGMSAYLVTDCRIPSSSHPWQGPQGTFSNLLQMLRTL